MKLCKVAKGPTIYKIPDYSEVCVLELSLLIVFVTAVVTDFLDGYLSRKWNTTSNFGKIYDPVADKAIIIGFFLYFLIDNTMFRLIPVLLIVRDIVSDYIRITRYKKNIITPAITTAKWKTATQMLCIVIIMLFFNLAANQKNSWWISSAITLVPLIFSYISFFQYIKGPVTNVTETQP